MHPNAQVLASNRKLAQHVIKAGVRSYYLIAGGYRSPITAGQADQLCRRLAGLPLLEAERLVEEART